MMGETERVRASLCGKKIPSNLFMGNQRNALIKWTFVTNNLLTSLAGVPFETLGADARCISSVAAEARQHTTAGTIARNRERVYESDEAHFSQLFACDRLRQTESRQDSKLARVCAAMAELIAAEKMHQTLNSKNTSKFMTEVLFR